MSGGDDGSVRVWAIGTWEQLAILDGHSDAVEDVAFSEDGG